jgi:hypothetical protein
VKQPNSPPRRLPAAARGGRERGAGSPAARGGGVWYLLLGGSGRDAPVRIVGFMEEIFEPGYVLHQRTNGSDRATN